ncbi:hypothetical protein M758_2G035700 [Ceratodon purpureus]|uniref:snRNA-activating protein complex subunit 3 n=1 Tax=Ceratodon purpureus TaxID=3225 RepID=A0A8T0ISL4_CERPU|nr:hypothetical protein KC19_2G037000 [Ceratodon purpureus]KAG0625200.1 hypothetical protein M758_2G035700 [Ceratodon purpureus]
MGATTGVAALGAPGGPLFVPGFVSGCLSVVELQRSWHTLISALEGDSRALEAEDDDVDVSVEDLKVVTDAQLVEKALAEVLDGGGNPKAGDGACLLLEDDPRQAAVEREGSGGPVEDPVPAEALLALMDGTSVASQEPEKKKSSRRRKKDGEAPKRKKGRPYDRSRGAGGGDVDEAAVRREEALIRMKQWRETERSKTKLHALRFKQEREAADEDNKTPLRRWRFFTSALHFPTKAPSDPDRVELLGPQEILFVVEFYHNQRKNDKMQEFLVLGSQFLSALRDRLYCLTDELARKSNLDTKSSFFLIEDVFYNDMRNPDAKDYSQPILQWAAESRQSTERWNRDLGNNPRAVIPAIHSETGQLPDFRSNDMQYTRFCELQLRVGAQYLYCHQGDCKHKVVIRDIRRAHAKDVRDVAAYPVLKWHARVRHRKCSICNIYQARKVTYEDKLAPACPSFFCEQCYYLLHYDKAGCLLYNDFKVYDYYHE